MRLMTSSRMAEATSRAEAPVTRVALVDDAGLVCIALAHPAVSPRYVSTPQVVYLQRANAAAKHITLPDVAELGTALLKHVTGRAVGLDGPVFQTPVAELEAHVKDLLAQINRSLDSASRPRVTLAKVAGKLPSLLARAGLDEVGVALVCGDTRYAGQARLHYTQHRTGHLVQFYTKAVRRLFREAGRPILGRPRTELRSSGGLRKRQARRQARASARLHHQPESRDPNAAGVDALRQTPIPLELPPLHDGDASADDRYLTHVPPRPNHDRNSYVGHAAGDERAPSIHRGERRPVRIQIAGGGGTAAPAEAAAAPGRSCERDMALAPDGPDASEGLSI